MTICILLKRNEGFSMLSMSFHKAFQTRPQNRGAGEHKPNLKPFDLRSVHGTFSFTADDVTFVWGEDSTISCRDKSINKHFHEKEKLKAVP